MEKTSKFYRVNKKTNKKEPLKYWDFSSANVDEGDVCHHVQTIRFNWGQYLWVSKPSRS